jgi:hypothetical protein
VLKIHFFNSLLDPAANERDCFGWLDVRRRCGWLNTVLVSCDNPAQQIEKGEPKYF